MKIIANMPHLRPAFCFLLICLIGLISINLHIFRTCREKRSAEAKERDKEKQECEKLKEVNAELPVCQNKVETLQEKVGGLLRVQRSLDLEVRAQKWMFIDKMFEKEHISRRLPSFIVIGAQKCGTYAFSEFLKPHPLLRNRIPIEAHFFEGTRRKKMEEYIAGMPEAEDNAIIFEKTAAYFSYPPAIVPERVRKVTPNAKLILILCDPIKRVVSDFVQQTIMGDIKKEQYPTIESYLNAYMNKYRKYGTWNSYQEMKDHSEEVLEQHYKDYPSTILTTGLYALHLSRWYEHYNSSNLHIINGDEMLSNPGKIIEEAQEFLQLPKFLFDEDYVMDPKTGGFCFLHPVTKKKSCIGSYKMRTRNGKVKIEEKILKLLREFYKVPNELLYRFIKKRFDW